MSFAFRETIPATHHVSYCTEYAPDPDFTVPIGATSIGMRDRVAIFHHFLQPAGNHTELYTQAAKHLEEDAARAILCGMSPDLRDASCLHTAFHVGYMTERGGPPAVHYSYAIDQAEHTADQSKWSIDRYDPDASAYIAELGARGLWVAIHQASAQRMHRGGTIIMEPTPQQLAQATVEYAPYTHTR